MQSIMNTEALEIYDLLKKNYPENEAQKFIAYFENSKDKENEITAAVERKIEHLATKEEMARQFGEAKADNIKWMFIFWIGQVAATVGLVLALIKR